MTSRSAGLVACRANGAPSSDCRFVVGVERGEHRGGRLPEREVRLVTGGDLGLDALLVRVGDRDDLDGRAGQLLEAVDDAVGDLVRVLRGPDRQGGARPGSASCAGQCGGRSLAAAPAPGSVQPAERERGDASEYGEPREERSSLNCSFCGRDHSDCWVAGSPAPAWSVLVARRRVRAAMGASCRVHGRGFPSRHPSSVCQAGRCAGNSVATGDVATDRGAGTTARRCSRRRGARPTPGRWRRHAARGRPTRSSTPAGPSGQMRVRGRSGRRAVASRSRTASATSARCASSMRLR